MSREKVFSESEAAEIVQRAVKLQEQEAKSAEVYTPGVTKEELWRIAQEVGLSREAFERAIDEYRSGKPEPGKRKLKIGTEIERVVDGEIPPEDFDILSDILRRKAMNAPPTQVGRTMHAKCMTMGAITDVSVTSRNGRTRLKIESSPLLGIIFGIQSAFLGSGIGMGLIFDEKNLIGGIAAFVIGWILGAVIFTGVLQGSRKAVRKLADDLVSRLEETVRKPSVAESASAEEPAPLQQRLDQSN